MYCSCNYTLAGVLTLLNINIVIVNISFVLLLCRGDFKMMDDSDRSTNVSTFQNFYEACEHILLLKSDKKQKRNMYCWILWSAYAVLVLIVFVWT